MNWFEAENYCKQLGGGLASIHTKEGMNAIAAGQSLSTKSNGFWLGLNSINAPPIVQWNDNTPITFTNWNTGEPNNYNKVEYCTEIISSQFWNDINWYFFRKNLIFLNIKFL